MKIDDIFNDIRNRLVNGAAMHKGLSCIMAFMNIDAFYSLQQLRYSDESKTLEELDLYYITRYHKILNDKPVSSGAIIPPDLFGNKDSAAQSVSYVFNSWVTWEEESKKYYENMYTELYNLHEIAACEMLSKIIKGTDKELVYAQQIRDTLINADYDESFIHLYADTLKKEIFKKCKKLCRDILKTYKSEGGR